MILWVVHLKNPYETSLVHLIDRGV